MGEGVSVHEPLGSIPCQQGGQARERRRRSGGRRGEVRGDDGGAWCARVQGHCARRRAHAVSAAAAGGGGRPVQGRTGTGRAARLRVGRDAPPAQHPEVEDSRGRGDSAAPAERAATRRRRAGRRQLAWRARATGGSGDRAGSSLPCQRCLTVARWRHAEGQLSASIHLGRRTSASDGQPSGVGAHAPSPPWAVREDPQLRRGAGYQLSAQPV